VDDKGNLVIADSFNNRVLEYNHALSTGRQSATMVYGQNGNFTTNAANFGGVSASALSLPVGLTLDRNGNLWVSDELNNRVLEYPLPSGSCKSCTVAINVLGQRGSFTTNGSNQGGLDAGSLDTPTGIAFDGAGNAYVADQGNNDRILEYFGPQPARTGS
jgi:sugar lactone lactonase YvrE